jgi:hypothetical protein
MLSSNPTLKLDLKSIILKHERRENTTLLTWIMVSSLRDVGRSELLQILVKWKLSYQCF